MTTPDRDPIALQLISSNFPDDTLQVVRDLLAVAAAAVNAPYPWDRCGEGLVRLLALVDTALAYELDHRRPWANPFPATDGGCTDAAE